MQTHRCFTCDKNNIKLYRPYGMFLRDTAIFCIVHIPEDQLEWYVPLVEDTDGTVWGHTSIPQEAKDRFNSRRDNK